MKMVEASPEAGRTFKKRYIQGRSTQKVRCQVHRLPCLIHRWLGDRVSSSATEIAQKYMKPSPGGIYDRWGAVRPGGFEGKWGLSMRPARPRRYLLSYGVACCTLAYLQWPESPMECQVRSSSDAVVCSSESRKETKNKVASRVYSIYSQLVFV